jgi:hypothetical protein
MSSKTTVKKKKFLTPIDKALFNEKHKSVRNHYGKYTDKILEVTGGRILYGYDEFNKG